MTPPDAPTAHGLLLDIGGVVLRNGKELVWNAAADEPEVMAFVREIDFGGPGDELWQAMLRHEVRERAYWAQRADEIGRLKGETWTTYDLISWLYHTPDEVWLEHETVDLMREVRGAGLKLAALTNDLVDFHGQEWVDQQEWLRLFDVIIDASITGVLKPDPRAYAAAVEAMGLTPSEVVYLDDMPVNVAGGLQAGLQAIEVVYDDRHAALHEARRRLGLTPVTV